MRTIKSCIVYCYLHGLQNKFTGLNGTRIPYLNSVRVIFYQDSEHKIVNFIVIKTDIGFMRIIFGALNGYHVAGRPVISGVTCTRIRGWVRHTRKMNVTGKPKSFRRIMSSAKRTPTTKRKAIRFERFTETAMKIQSKRQLFRQHLHRL
jgi:hypothetical protein